ncbi:MAG: hypothetical protein ACRCU5_14120 [Rhizobiaceae bacterium]
MRIVFNIFIASAFLVSALLPINAAVAAPKRVAGFSCSFQRAPPGTWIGYFQGVKESPIISFGDRYYPVSILRCFNTRADCNAWKYWVQTDYPIAVRTASCKRK